MAPARPVTRGRATGDPAVVALRMEAVALWIIQCVAKMPREHRFTLGDRLIETSLEVTTLLFDASYRRDKAPLLAEAGRGLTRLACSRGWPTISV
ncbi:MAG: four helix bundle protein [Polyangiaceae bacterium]|nr:four helix bundle protein [Polyangiaceae bacterium]